MSVRHRIAVPVLAAALGLTLTGCGTSESGSSSASSSSGSGSVADASALDKAKVSGGEAEVAPAVTLGTKPLSATSCDGRFAALSNVRSSITSATGNETGSYLARCTASPGISA